VSFVRKIVDSREWAEVVDPAWGIEFGAWDTGYELAGWDASVWILHAMYEHPEIPGGLSHDDVDRMERSAGLGEPLPQTDVGRIIEEMTEGSTLIGSPGGASAFPGEGWERLWWRELAQRLGMDLFRKRRFPCFRTFAYGSWPASIRPPAEGSLDLEQFETLVESLATFSPDEAATDCVWWFAPLTGDHHSPRIYRAPLSEFREVYALAGNGGPNNVWPVTREWFVWTDYDLWGTRVSGDRGLIDALLADPSLETFELELGAWSSSS